MAFSCTVVIVIVELLPLSDNVIGKHWPWKNEPTKETEGRESY